MKKCVLVFIILVLQCSVVFADTTADNGKASNLPSRESLLREWNMLQTQTATQKTSSNQAATTEVSATEIVKPTDRDRLNNAVVIKVGASNAYINNVYRCIDLTNRDIVPVAYNGCTLVPVRLISEGFGANVDWDNANSVATIKFNGKTVFLKLNDNYMTINGVKNSLPVPVQLVGGHVFIPLRALAENVFDKSIFYSNGLIIITDKEISFDCNADAKLFSDISNELTETPCALIGNLSQSGWAAEQGDCIYYVIKTNTEDNNAFGIDTLYKEKMDGSNRQVLITGKRIHNLNIVGDWIYYLREPDNGDFNSDLIYKIKTDGTGNMPVSNNVKAFENLIVIRDWTGDWIYFNNVNDGSKLYRMKTDGSSLEKLYNGRWDFDVQKQGNKIYSYYGEALTLGSNYSETLISNDDEMFIDRMSYFEAVCYVQDGWVYYFKSCFPDEKFQLVRRQLGKTDEIALKEFTLDQYTKFSFILSGDWIYYNYANSAYLDQTQELFGKIKIDGNNDTIIFNGKTSYVTWWQVLDDCILCLCHKDYSPVSGKNTYFKLDINTGAINTLGN